eukprot:TRINITY_DN3732_c0_g1_i2.p2 TRINITY_DN3732_c0_g1~~TRINITY_DN3732_c0_g1_i2.p2  ORF type:complete len:137 (+),score=25.85 TRINITY_DN3732_c0_g1_i2:59-412(+)
MKALLAVCFLSVVSGESCDVPCSSFTNRIQCMAAMTNTCALCNWDSNRIPSSTRCYEDPDFCSDCKCRDDASSTCPLFNTKDRCERLNKGDCVVCGMDNGKCTKASCSGPCSNGVSM